ncbi:ATP-dependent RNA helicase dbp6 [Tulasnella sp. 419]|nr:ATP-dependent RNA helicase dbp6 [Tulasnella sp. 419]
MADVCRKSPEKPESKHRKKKKDKKHRHSEANATTDGPDDRMEDVVTEPVQSDDKSSQPFKKKRKVDPSISVPESSVIQEEQTPEVPEEAKLTVPLPIFPAPKQPNAPSPAILSRQGLDKALLGAEIVDATITAPLESTDDNPNLDKFGLSGRMRKRLQDLGITELFAVQTALLPFLSPPDPQRRMLYTPYDPPQDVCVSAPTGSGKTLAYVVPIVEILSTRIVTRLRALVVLPTRDLVSQVRETFEAVAKGRGLKIGVATGQHSFAQEQAHLVGSNDAILLGGSSKVDILICTPGRLIDHLKETSNFTLQHLRFLVIDEADRLITQSFQDWLPQVLVAIRPGSGDMSAPLTTGSPIHDAVAPHWSSLLPNARSHIVTYLDEPEESSCQKLLFSATLTHDPGKIAALNLRNPKYFVVSGQTDNSVRAGEDFTVPATLSEHMIVTSAFHKPLVLFHLLHSPTYSITNALVFTKSAESTSRLVKLLDFLETSRQSGFPDQKSVIVAKAYSSDLNQNERKTLLRRFRDGEVQVQVLPTILDSDCLICLLELG